MDHQFDADRFRSELVKGRLRAAMSYLSRFPDQSERYARYTALFQEEKYLTYEVDPELNGILLCYQKYYRETFYLEQTPEEAARRLWGRLADCFRLSGDTADAIETERVDAAFRAKGFHFLGGRTSGYWGPYIWRDEEVKRYAVELPDGEREYAVKFLDGFIMKSWLDYISLGETGTGGWSDGDGLICCVRDAYDLDTESFRVSLLKHEAQHAADLETYRGMSSEDLEYRAKLVELIYSRERNLLERFAGEADASRAGNGHGIAACRILEGAERLLNIPREALTSLPVEEMQAAARTLFEESTREAGKKYNKTTP